jgi:hypothetical protein
VLQPGAEFDSTDSGFDTGSATFRCYTSKVATLSPRSGTSFRSMRFYAADNTLTSGRYPYMFVKSCKEVDAKLGVSTLSVTFRGQKTRPGESMPRALKAPFLQQAQAQQQIDAGGTQITLSLPVVTKIYLVTDLAALDPMNSPVAAPDGIASPSLTFEGLTLPTPRYAGWRITGRQHESCGKLHQVQDTLTYVLGI